LCVLLTGCASALIEAIEKLRNGYHRFAVVFPRRRRDTRWPRTGVQTCALPIFVGRNGEGELIGGAGVDPVVEGRVHGGAGRLLVVTVLLRLLARIRTVVVEVGDRPVLCLSLLPGAQAGTGVECARRHLQVQTRLLDRLLGRIRDQPADRQSPLLIDPGGHLVEGDRHIVLLVVGVLRVIGGGRVRCGRRCRGGRGCGGRRECENRPCQQEECAQQGGDQSQAADGNGFHGSSRDTIGDAAATMRRS